MKFLKQASYCLLALAAGVVIALGFRAYVDNEAHASRSDELASLDSFAGQPSPRVAFLDPAPIADDPPVIEPDPVEDPGGFFSKVYQLYKDGALLPAVLLAAFGLAMLLGRYVPWIKQGSRQFIFAAVVMGLTSLAEPASRGATPTLGMFLGALFSAALFYINSRNAAKPALKSVP